MDTTGSHSELGQQDRRYSGPVPTQTPAAVAPLHGLRDVRTYIDIAVVVAVLVATNLIAHFTTPWANFVVVPIAAIGLLALIRYRGHSWAELGLGRDHWRSGAKYAAVAVVIVGAVIGIGLLLPITRPMFLNSSYATTVSGALLASFVLIPLQTVIPEELAFRGVLHGTMARAWGFRGVAAVGSLLFGFWHIATSLGLTTGNVGLTRLLGVGLWAQIAGVAGAVVATAIAGFVFTWLRRRSGSLLAPIALHWSLNGMGVLAAVLVWHLI
ncbi:Conserved hypothetical protein (abortive infection protein?) [Mycobacteroides abscessus]|nr:abortive infection protein [Mycobacteroides abscessus V06705]CPZ81705.1 Conserved hypothetical protein (abortive infection protein?) [Mycobacteroides abscessus]SHP44504.1 CAAX amino terminal protease self-immunity [Mycobacteroides abscessus subsp. abscessus]SHX50331.1 CAAX amino terminal protease family [Mycobacteroides abscessus subsp. abscessus]SIG34969.1 CAAX amino terminal protease family [Mycobacteroides abscessus subsp. abscessus]